MIRRILARATMAVIVGQALALAMSSGPTATVDPVARYLDSRPDCRADNGPVGEIPASAIIAKNGRVGETHNAHAAILVALGERPAPAGLTVVAFCYESLAGDNLSTD